MGLELFAAGRYAGAFDRYEQISPDHQLLRVQATTSEKAVLSGPQNGALHRYLTLQEAADYWSVNPVKIRRYITDGRLRGYRPRMSSLTLVARPAPGQSLDGDKGMVQVGPAITC